MKIVLVEDDVDVCAELGYQLGMCGHQLTALGSCGEFKSWIRENDTPDVLLLDLGLPDCDGLVLARYARDELSHMAVIVLTARTHVDARVEGWKSGADGYLTKPFEVKELIAVLESAERRLDERNQSHGHCWTLDVIGNSITAPCGEVCKLSVVERQLLRAFARSPGHPVERELLVRSLGKELWEYDMRRLEAAISRLRRKFTGIGCPKDVLRAVRGVGYLFAGQIRIRDGDAD